VGGGRSRTADLSHVVDALYYLSYPPLYYEKKPCTGVLAAGLQLLIVAAGE
jgi:hypothetical protein